MKQTHSHIGSRPYIGFLRSAWAGSWSLSHKLYIDYIDMRSTLLHHSTFSFQVSAADACHARLPAPIGIGGVAHRSYGHAMSKMHTYTQTRIVVDCRGGKESSISRLSLS